MKKDNKDLLVKILVFSVFLAGILIKLFYIQYTEVWERQHDVISFGAAEGHAAYIEYILNNGRIPDFDPRSLWAFFQPPLHHIICAIILKVCGLIGIADRASQEFLQVVTTIYMIIVMVTSVMIYYLTAGEKAKKSSIQRRMLFAKQEINNNLTPGLYVMLCVVALHPIFTLMSGSINNDALSLVLSVVSLYLAVKWYENPKMVRIIPLAVIIGLAMVAKLTGGLVAVPIGTLMLLRFFDVFKAYRLSKKASSEASPVLDKKVNTDDYKNGDLLDVVFQYIAFAIIVFPLGLSWTIRNKIRFDMPANYIPPVGEQLGEDMTLSKRLFDLSINNPFPVIEGNNGSYSEYNVFVSLIKTSLFGEWDFSTYSGKLTIVAWALVFIAVVLIVLCLVATFAMTFSKKSSLSLEGKIVLFLTWITYLGAYLAFALSYNNFSAEDFRYGAICIIPEGIFLGRFYENTSSKVLKKVIFAVATLFAALAFALYALIGIKAMRH